MNLPLVHPFSLSFLLALFLIQCPASAADPKNLRPIGVAKVDVTPAFPIRLTGYAVRKSPSEGIEQKLWAKALAIGSDRERPAVLITLDNCGIADETYREVAKRLRKHGIKQDRFTIACSHTHSGPVTKSWAPNIFVQDLPANQQATIDGYTRELTDKLEQVVIAALRDRRPGYLSWSQGAVSFARNRRVVHGHTAVFGDNASAPVDHSLPVLKATGADGRIRALVANYACHCTTLGGEFNHVCGDWAGYAQEAIERDSPGAVALITIGCGADANPSPRGGADFGLALAKRHGASIASEVKRLLMLNFTPLAGKLRTEFKEIALPFGAHFTRDQWLARSTNSGIVGYHARKWLARLDRGEKLPAGLYYPVTAWHFGDDLAMVFLPGEVVVDYAQRLKRELEAARLWVTAYANYVPCYIPSRRILTEGGYEAEDSLWYYDRPARISTNAEDLIIRTVRGLLPKAFRADPTTAEFPAPKNPEQALETFRTKADLGIEIVASEPLVESPVAIDWDARGRLWVCEMFDYPTGLDLQYKAGGRIKILTDSNGDGRYDKATLFLAGLAFPTGVTPWRKGALICSAPNILYAEDTDGDDRADLVRTNFSGFATHNYQARVNGFTWGLDGWLHGSSGLFGGKITSHISGQVVDLSGRDFRIRPTTGEIEPVAGISQMGRVRDDFDNWFGNDNSTLLWHFPLPDHYARRNPRVTYPEPRVNVAADARNYTASKGAGPHTDPKNQSLRASGAPANPNLLFPISRTLERFNDPDSANHVTGACGPEIYRDELLEPDYYGNAFICEPVHNLIRRLVVEPNGVTFHGRRAADEQKNEFLASTDNWFRPVQARTGPDGALWIVDMYRFVIEHPRWIPTNRLAQLDVRAGADKGRIYRIYPIQATLRPIRDLTKLSPPQLVQMLETPNGPARDLIHRELLDRGSASTSALPLIRRLAGDDETAAAIRVQALHLLDQLGDLTTDLLLTALTNDAPALRCAAGQLCERALGQDGLSNSPSGKALALALVKLASDEDPRARFQVALSAGSWREGVSADLMVPLIKSGIEDAWFRAALLSSAAENAGQMLDLVLSTPVGSDAVRLVEGFSRSLTAQDRLPLFRALARVTSDQGAFAELDDPLRLETLAILLETFKRTDLNWRQLSESSEVESLFKNAVPKLRPHPPEEFMEIARRIVTGDSVDQRRAKAAVRLLCHQPDKLEEDIRLLAEMAGKAGSSDLRQACLARLRERAEPWVATVMLSHWLTYPPQVRESLISVLLSRAAWTEALLRSISRDGLISKAEVSMHHRERLLKHERPDIRERAAKLFGPATSSNRAKLVATFQPAADLLGIPERGSAAFEKNCASCHAFRGRGHEVGPNLIEFTGKSAQDFLVAILDPNAAINPNFIAYNIEVKDGRSLTGIVRGETASSLTLVQGGGVRETIPRAEISEIRASQVSLMPENLEQAMTQQDIADLLAWLKRAGPAQFGRATAEQAAEARIDFAKRGGSALARLVSAAEQLPYPSWLGRLPLAHCRQTDGRSRLVWEAASAGRVSLGGAWQFRFPVAFGLRSQPEGKFQLSINGRQALQFDVTLDDAVWQSGDRTVVLRYEVMENNSEDSNGIATLEITDRKWVEQGKSVTIEVVGTAANSQRWFGVYLLEERKVAGNRN
jgi:putative membrane-bound dehydrogenase-like protein